MDHKIELQYGDDVQLVLPDGQEVSIQLNCLEPEDQLPELDIWFQADQTANCFQAGLVPAESNKDYPNVLDVRQITIPIKPLSDAT